MVQVWINFSKKRNLISLFLLFKQKSWTQVPVDYRKKNNLKPPGTVQFFFISKCIMSIIKRVILSEKSGAISDLILDEILRPYICIILNLKDYQIYTYVSIGRISYNELIMIFVHKKTCIICNKMHPNVWSIYITRLNYPAERNFKI